MHIIIFLSNFLSNGGERKNEREKEMGKINLKNGFVFSMLDLK